MTVDTLIDMVDCRYEDHCNTEFGQTYIFLFSKAIARAAVGLKYILLLAQCINHELLFLVSAFQFATARLGGASMQLIARFSCIIIVVGTNQLSML